MRSARWSLGFAVILFSASVAVAAVPEAKEAKPPEAAKGDDAKEIQGTWKVLSFVHGGKTEADPGITLIIGGGVITVMSDGKATDTDKYEMNPKASPKTFDLTDRGETAHGIYSLSGDDLKIVVPEPAAAPRPTNSSRQPIRRPR